MNATANDTIRFTTVRLAGRWKVQDAATGETVTCASRAKAEERAAKLNAAEERAGTTLQERSTAAAEDALIDAINRGDEAGADNARVALGALPVVTLDGTETTVLVEETVESYGPDAVVVTREYEPTRPRAARAAARAAILREVGGDLQAARQIVAATELAEAVNAGTITFAEAAAKLPAAAPAEKAEPMKSLWVAAAFVPIILADEAPERATLVAKLDASVPNNRGGRTVRLTRAEAEELAAIGTEIENSVSGAGRMAHSARTMRNRLAALWA